MLDGILLEKAGVPAVSIITEPFRVTGREMATNWGVPEYRFIEMPHPISNLTEEELNQRADALAVRLSADRDQHAIERLGAAVRFALEAHVNLATRVGQPGDFRTQADRIEQAVKTSGQRPHQIAVGARQETVGHLDYRDPAAGGDTSG